MSITTGNSHSSKRSGIRQGRTYLERYHLQTQDAVNSLSTDLHCNNMATLETVYFNHQEVSRQRTVPTICLAYLLNTRCRSHSCYFKTVRGATSIHDPARLLPFPPKFSCLVSSAQGESMNSDDARRGNFYDTSPAGYYYFRKEPRKRNEQYHHFHRRLVFRVHMIQPTATTEREVHRKKNHSSRTDAPRRSDQI